MKFAAAAGAALALAATATPAAAISTYNSRPAPHRTNVGALVVEYDADGDPATAPVRDWFCSGTMIDRDTFLTAAHCTTGWPEGSRFFVSLAQQIDEAALRTAVEGTAHSDPAYPGNSADSHDIAVVELGSRAGSLPGFTPATLPGAGQLSAMGPQALRDTRFIVAGYGTQEAQRGPGGHTHPGGGERREAPLMFNALSETWLRLSMVEPRGNGGACYGDSGGPNFARIGGREVLVGTTITGDAPCYATNVAYRLDAPSARRFLAPFVALP
ncbi:MAG: trypsin-like serine protease [Actinomycetota bacterium]|nr:trypsin-like serine protease [Actinomycetota bacterium]